MEMLFLVNTKIYLFRFHGSRRHLDNGLCCFWKKKVAVPSGGMSGGQIKYPNIWRSHRNPPYYQDQRGQISLRKWKGTLRRVGHTVVSPYTQGRYIRISTRRYLDMMHHRAEGRSQGMRSINSDIWQWNSSRCSEPAANGSPATNQAIQPSALTSG